MVVTHDALQDELETEEDIAAQLLSEHREAVCRLSLPVGVLWLLSSVDTALHVDAKRCGPVVLLAQKEVLALSRCFGYRGCSH